MTIPTIPPAVTVTCAAKSELIWVQIIDIGYTMYQDHLLLVMEL